MTQPSSSITRKPQLHVFPQMPYSLMKAHSDKLERLDNQHADAAVLLCPLSFCFATLQILPLMPGFPGPREFPGLKLW